MGTKIAGVALVPSISLNRRKYTREHVAGAVAEAAGRIEAGRFLMASSHGAIEDDDSLRIVGRVTGLRVDEHGRAVYSGELVDTEQGRTIAALCAARPPLVQVSIRGEWHGEMHEENSTDGPVTYGDRLVLHGLDFTGRPGIEASSAATVESRLRSANPRQVRESVTVTEQHPPALTRSEVLERWFDQALEGQRATAAVRHAVAVEYGAAGAPTSVESVAERAAAPLPPATEDERRARLAALVWGR